MTRQTWTAFVSAVCFIALAVLIAVLPVPFVAWSPGDTEDVLGAVKGQPIITVEGTATYPTDGQLDLTVVSGTAADSRLSLPEALLAFWIPGRDTLPRDAVYPPGQSADQVRQAETQMMAGAQDDAVIAALRAAGQQVTEMPRVSAVTVGGPSHQRLQPGDLIVSVDGVSATSTDVVQRQIRSHTAGETVQFTVLRSRQSVTVDVKTVSANGQSAGTPVVGISLGTGYDYAPRIRYDLGQQLGGPSAGTIFALAIYDKITPGALLGGRHIAGTGEIDPAGNVGAIGGIQQKIAGAQHAGATAFLVPAPNCGDLAGVKSNMSLIRIDTLQTAIAAVQTYVAQGPDAPGLPRC